MKLQILECVTGQILCLADVKLEEMLSVTFLHHYKFSLFPSPVSYCHNAYYSTFVILGPFSQLSESSPQMGLSIYIQI